MNAIKPYFDILFISVPIVEMVTAAVRSYFWSMSEKDLLDQLLLGVEIITICIQLFIFAMVTNYVRNARKRYAKEVLSTCSQ